jgi:hypothetical protein
MTWKDYADALHAVLVIVLSVLAIIAIVLRLVLWISPLPEPPTVQYRLAVYPYLTTEEATIDGTLQYTSVRLDLDHYTEYSPLACDEIIADDNGHTCYVSDPAGVSVILDDNHIRR